jgi:peptide deformylase
MSAKDTIITLPNEHLRERSRRVGIITDEIRDVINKMKEATLDWEASRAHEVGVALAAIQIDKAFRVIVIRRNFDNKEDHTFDVFINPEITKYEGEIEEDYEGCLSVLDVYGKVPRHTKVRLRALDENGHEVRIKAQGFLARVVQHEIDHLNGMLFIDHIEDDEEAFYKITQDGKLEKQPYEQVKKTGIFKS